MMERRAVAGGSLGSADIIGVAVEANDANAQVFQVRDGVLAERQGFYLAGADGDEERDPVRSPRRSCSSTTARPPQCPAG